MEDRTHFAGQDILMSFGLLTELTQIIGDPGRVAVIDFDPAMQEQVLKACLAKRTPLGRVTEHFDLDTLSDFTLRDIEGLFSWVKEHVVDFFIRRLKDSANLIAKNQEQMKALELFTTGSASAASPT